MPIHKAEQCCLSLVPSGFRGEYLPSHKLSPIRDTQPVPRRRILARYGANAGGSAGVAGPSLLVSGSSASEPLPRATRRSIFAAACSRDAVLHYGSIV